MLEKLKVFGYLHKEIRRAWKKRDKWNVQSEEI